MKNMFKPNDVVLCIDNKHFETKEPSSVLKESKHYTVNRISQCCTTRISLKEIPDSDITAASKGMFCVKCGSDNAFGYFGWRFIKLAGPDIDTEETTCSDLPKQKKVQGNVFTNALKRLKEKVPT